MKFYLLFYLRTHEYVVVVLTGCGFQLRMTFHVGRDIKQSFKIMFWWSSLSGKRLPLLKLKYLPKGDVYILKGKTTKSSSVVAKTLSVEEFFYKKKSWLLRICPVYRRKPFQFQLPRFFLSENYLIYVRKKVILGSRGFLYGIAIFPYGCLRGLYLLFLRTFFHRKKSFSANKDFIF